MMNTTAKAVLFGLGLTLAASVAAVEVERLDFQAASGICQANTPAFSGNIRFRPLSADNTGTTDQYLNCALQGDVLGRGSSQVSVRVQNAATVSRTVNCVLVNGYRANPTTTFATYTNQSVAVAAGGSAFIHWVPGDIVPVPASGEIDLPNVQCLLPEGTGLNYAFKFYLEDIGA